MLLLGAASAFAQSNLPLGLPADQLAPTKLDGYRLVSLDRTKEIVLEISGKRVTVEVPLFIYLPETDHVGQMKSGLKAIHEDLARLAASREPVDPQRLMTLFLALDRVLNAPDPVSVQGPEVPARESETAAAPVAPAERLERAVSQKNG